MRIIALIEKPEVIKEILTHLGVYLVRSKAPPRAPPKELARIFHDSDFVRQSSGS
jgi:hypothetical protein